MTRPNRIPTHLGRQGLGVSLGLVLLLSGAAALADPKVGEAIPRRGDEIVVCGQLFHTTTPVVLWMDPGGYDAYRVDRRFGPIEKAAWKKDEGDRSPNRYSQRKVTLTSPQREQVRGGGWDLSLLRDVVDKFVVHFDAAGTSQSCYRILHDERGLSVHFMLDLDGTIYQTLDLKEGAWHATKANAHSIGIEIANVGAYPVDGKNPFEKWYKREGDGKTTLVLPAGQAERKDGPLHPSRPDPITGNIQGQDLKQYDLTPQQYDALTKLTATLCTVFPKIKCDYPKDASGALITRKLPDADFDKYQGVLGHYHVQTNKVDPGPAFQWDKVIDGARALMAK